nr:hypothetical protein [Rhizobium leguminosarum]
MDEYEAALDDHVFGISHGFDMDGMSIQRRTHLWNGVGMASSSSCQCVGGDSVGEGGCRASIPHPIHEVVVTSECDIQKPEHEVFVISTKELAARELIERLDHQFHGLETLRAAVDDVAEKEDPVRFGRRR